MKHEIIIGSETEYGILVTTDDGRAYSGLNDSFSMSQCIGAMLEEGIAVSGGGICRETGTISSARDHASIERIAHLRDDEDACNFSDIHLPIRRAGILQRRGYTGSMLVNGARFYNDMMHPEYSCPECRDPYTALCAQKAGDAIVHMSAERAKEVMGVVFGMPAEAMIIKNNSDGLGHSYAGHENYSVSRELFRKLEMRTSESDASVLFFVARQVVLGAGKVGDDLGRGAPFQISQRADFFRTRSSSDTVMMRGIINTRDVSYSDWERRARFHVIVGDSNRSDVSLFLKFGTTALFLMMMEDGFLEKHFPWYGSALKRPVRALWDVSRDLTLTKPVLRFDDDRKTTALHVMWDFLACAERFVCERGLPTVWHRITTLLRDALDGLSGNRHKHPISRSLDWVALERLLLLHINRGGEGWGSEELRDIDIGYRLLGDDSVYAALERVGEMFSIANEQDVKTLIHTPPSDTRAWLRSEIIKRWKGLVQRMRWSEIYLPHGIAVNLHDPFWGGKSDAEALFIDDPSLEQFLERVRRLSVGHVKVYEVFRSARRLVPRAGRQRK